ncbi:NUDIX domain-containing protein [Savagea sp. SN6]|uniref:NUDIX domain-containing protein n=1 Tax=Savagea serpentis TaxID=2785297 RepID=A0A8J7KLQ2_9BACL|nr:NUDIX domain-containing protein [Savagea serpentis]MBF4501589.1 NUDIX domain-containing protein [Savagea serpentis]
MCTEEWIQTYDESHRPLSRQTRDDVHKLGLWHDTFHCWLVERDTVLLQKRSTMKKDFASLYDVTAAGHLQAEETIADGVRELEEELGLKRNIEDLTFGAVIRDTIQIGDWIDREFTHVYFHSGPFEPEQFTLQTEEVETLVCVSKRQLIQLFEGQSEFVDTEDIFTGERQCIAFRQFVPHERNYYAQCAKLLKTI